MMRVFLSAWSVAEDDEVVIRFRAGFRLTCFVIQALVGGSARETRHNNARS